jgi:hypothetical protein
MTAFPAGAGVLCQGWHRTIPLSCFGLRRKNEFRATAPHTPGGLAHNPGPHRGLPIWQRKAKNHRHTRRPLQPDY